MTNRGSDDGAESWARQRGPGAIDSGYALWDSLTDSWPGRPDGLERSRHAGWAAHESPRGDRLTPTSPEMVNGEAEPTFLKPHS